jgi:hypothetical protein
VVAEETKPVPAKKLLTYDPKPPDRHLDPGCEIVSRAVEIIRPSPDDESMCRMMVVYAISLCRVEKEDVRPAFLASGKELSSTIEKLESAEKALVGLRRLYKRLAFPDRDDFDSVGVEEAERLGKIRRALKTLLIGMYRLPGIIQGIMSNVPRPHTLIVAWLRIPTTGSSCSKSPRRSGAAKPTGTRSWRPSWRSSSAGAPPQRRPDGRSCNCTASTRRTVRPRRTDGRGLAGVHACALRGLG